MMATKEMELAQQMMAKGDIQGCKSHIHSRYESHRKVNVSVSLRAPAVD